MERQHTGLRMYELMWHPGEPLPYSVPRAMHLWITVVRLTTSQVTAPIRICKALCYERKVVIRRPPDTPNSYVETLTQCDGVRRWGLGETSGS